MTTAHVSDFEAAKLVAEQLAGMDKDRQERILRWVAESLNLLQLPATGPTGPMSPGLTSADAQSATGIHARQTVAPDIKSFVESKKPKSDTQFAAVVAYFYQFEAPHEQRRDTIDATTLIDAARLSGRRRPDAKDTLNNAKKLGYLDSPDRGQFSINSVGENLVAMTLPGDGSRENGGRGGRRTARNGVRKRSGAKARPRKASRKK